MRTSSSGPTVGWSTLILVSLSGGVERLEHAADLSGGHSLGVEQLDPVGGRTGCERPLELGGELGAVLDAPRVGGEALVGEEVVPPERAAELREQPVVGRRDRDQAVLRPQRLVGGDAPVGIAEAAAPPRR